MALVRPRFGLREKEDRSDSLEYCLSINHRSRGCHMKAPDQGHRSCAIG